MDDAAIYRKLAGTCVERATATPDADTAAGLMQLSRYWLQKAREAEAKSRDNSADG